MSLEKTKCNICDLDQAETLFPGPEETIVRCKKCGLVYRNPRYPAMSRSNYMYDFDKVQKAKTKLFQKNIKRISKYTNKGKLLDVGCGDGYFLKLARENGWEPFGIEVSSSICELAKKRDLDVFCGFLSDAKFPSNHFDAITLWDLLYMLEDPVSELERARNILKDDGVIVLRTSNATFQVTVQLLFGKIASWLKISPTIFHLYCFSPKTIKLLLKKTGLMPVKILNSELTSGDPYKSGGLLGGIVIQLIKNLVYWSCQAVYYLSLGHSICGPSMIVIIKKSK